MINLEEQFSPRVNPADANYPFGSLKDNTSPGANDGTPLSAVWGNNWEGFAQAAMTEAGITPSGLPDTAQDSQLLDAVKAVTSGALRDSVSVVFDNVEEMKAAFLQVGTTCRTSGYFTPGDGGGADFIIAQSQTVDGYGSHNLSNGNVALINVAGTINVLQFGFVENQVIDENLNALIATANARGLNIRGVPKTYLRGDGVVPALLGIEFDGSGITILKNATASGAYQMLVVGKGAAIKRANIIGDWDNGHSGSSGEHGHCIVMNGDNSTISQCVIKSAWGDGVYVAASATSISECTVINCRRNNISVIRGKSISIDKCVITGAGYRESDAAVGTSPWSGIDLEPNSGDSLINANITRCHFGQSYLAGINVSGVYTSVSLNIDDCAFLTDGTAIITGFSPRGFSISNCYFSNGTANSSLKIGVGIKQNTNAGAQVIEPVKVVNCTFEYLEYGITRQTGISSVFFSNNVFKKVSTPIRAYGLANADKNSWIISGNSFVECGMVLLEWCTGGVVSGNSFKSCSPADKTIYLLNSNSTLLVGNQFFNCSQGGVGAASVIYVDFPTSASDVLISGCSMVYSDALTTPQYVVQGRYGSTDVKLSGNFFKAAASLNCSLINSI